MCLALSTLRSERVALCSRGPAARACPQQRNESGSSFHISCPSPAEGALCLQHPPTQLAGQGTRSCSLPSFQEPAPPVSILPAAKWFRDREGHPKSGCTRQTFRPSGEKAAVSPQSQALMCRKERGRQIMSECYLCPLPKHFCLERSLMAQQSWSGGRRLDCNLHPFW